jgi:hypothetical protein
MNASSEGKQFAKLFLIFILIEVVLYTIIVYFDSFGIAIEGPVKKNPAFVVFYGLSSIIFVIFISRISKR